jgi:hypothetical protein
MNPTKLQQVAQRNGKGPRVPRLPVDRQAIADQAATKIRRLINPGKYRSSTPVPINDNGHEVSRADCLCVDTAGVFCPRCAPETYGQKVATHRGVA